MGQRQNLVKISRFKGFEMLASVGMSIIKIPKMEVFNYDFVTECEI